MTTKLTYYISYKKNGKTCYAWLNDTNIEGFEEPVVLEERTMLIATEEGKVLEKDGVQIGQCTWLRDSDSQDNYIEVEEKIVEPELPEHPEIPVEAEKVIEAETI